MFRHRAWFDLRCSYALPLGKLTRYARTMMTTEHSFTADGVVVKEKIPVGFTSDCPVSDVAEIVEYRLVFLHNLIPY